MQLMTDQVHRRYTGNERNWRWAKGYNRCRMQQILGLTRVQGYWNIIC
jgi:hypothetical protein